MKKISYFLSFAALGLAFSASTALACGMEKSASNAGAGIQLADDLNLDLDADIDVVSYPSYTDMESDDLGDLYLVDDMELDIDNFDLVDLDMHSNDIAKDFGEKDIGRDRDRVRTSDSDYDYEGLSFAMNSSDVSNSDSFSFVSDDGLHLDADLDFGREEDLDVGEGYDLDIHRVDDSFGGAGDGLDTGLVHA